MWVSVWPENGRPVQVESNSYPETIAVESNSYPETIAVFLKWKESEANAQQQFLVDGQPVYFLTYLKVQPTVEGEIKCVTPVATEDVKLPSPKTASSTQS